MYFTIAMWFLNMNCACTSFPGELSICILQIVKQAIGINFEMERSGTKSI